MTQEKAYNLSDLDHLASFLISNGPYAIILLFVFFFWFYASREYKSAKRALRDAEEKMPERGIYLQECIADCSSKRKFYLGVIVITIVMTVSMFALQLRTITSQESAVFTGKIIPGKYSKILRIHTPRNIGFEGNDRGFRWLTENRPNGSRPELFFYIIGPSSYRYKFNHSSLYIGQDKPASNNIEIKNLAIGEKQVGYAITEKVITLKYEGNFDYCIKETKMAFEINRCKS